MYQSQAVRNEQMAPILYELDKHAAALFVRANADGSWLDVRNDNDFEAVAVVWQRENGRAMWRRTETVTLPSNSRVFAEVSRIAAGTSGHVWVECSVQTNVTLGLFHAASAVRGLGFDDPTNSEWMVAI